MTNPFIPPVLLTGPAPADRRGFIGGSDAAAIFGFSPWSTPLELFLEKMGRAAPKPVDPQRERILKRGKILEATILEMLLDRLREDGIKVEVIATNQRYQDGVYDFLRCEIDFELVISGTVLIGDEEVTFDREHINGDCKSASGFARKKWGVENTEDVPIEYAAQFMHGMGITGRRYTMVAALMGLDDVRVYWVINNPETVEAMREKSVLFWRECIEKDTPPDPFTFSDIKLLFPLDNGQETEATPEVAEQVRELYAVKQRIKELKDREETLTFHVGEFISPNSVLTFEGKQLATWKAQQSRTIDSKQLREDMPDIAEQYTNTTTFRVLRISKPKN